MSYEENMALGGYNVFFTSLPCLIYGFFEQDVDATMSSLFPMVYRVGQVDGVLNLRTFLIWSLEAVFHAVVVFVIAFSITAELTTNENGTLFSIWDAGNAAYTVNLVVVTMRIGMDTMHWNFLVFLSYFGSVFLWLLGSYVYCSMSPEFLNSTVGYFTFYQSVQTLFGTINFWLVLMLSVVVCLLPTYVARSWEVVMTPNLIPGAPRPDWPIPDPKSDTSILYHLRHYMIYPERFLEGEKKRIYQEKKLKDMHAADLKTSPVIHA